MKGGLHPKEEWLPCELLDFQLEKLKRNLKTTVNLYSGVLILSLQDAYHPIPKF